MFVPLDNALTRLVLRAKFRLFLYGNQLTIKISDEYHIKEMGHVSVVEIQALLWLPLIAERVIRDSY